MIRFAKDSDISRIIRLWDEAFVYDDFGKWYFKNVFDIDNTLVYEMDNDIVACLQRIPYKIKDIGDATYIYGACTDKEYRNRGIMTKLLTYSEVIDIASGVDAVFLVPEKEDLFEFYEKKGYGKHFYKYVYDDKEIEAIKRTNKHIYNDNKLLDNIKMHEISKKAIATLKKNFPVDDDHIIQYLKKYASDMVDVYVKTNQNRNYIIRNMEMFFKQLSMHIETDGKVYVFYDNNELVGYAFGYVENNIYEISEIAYSNIDAYDSIIKLLNNEYININILNQLNGSIKVKYGCIKMLQKNLNINKVIINLVFD